MTPTLTTFLIVCPLVFLAGFVDAIGGGGGLISLPAYIIAGLPVHLAVGTNKLANGCGTALATAQFLRKGLVNMRLGVITIVFALIGSGLGANLSLLADESMLKVILLPVLIIAAFFVMNKKLFGRPGSDTVTLDRRTVITAGIAAFVIGIYDGFYGPGTGTFLIIALNVFARLDLKRANAQTKVINLTTNVTSFAVFLIHGQILWSVGLAAAVCNMAGNYIGANLAIRQGERITRPIILIMLAALAVKILMG